MFHLIPDSYRHCWRRIGIWRALGGFGLAAQAADAPAAGRVANEQIGQRRWMSAEAWDWYKKQPWIVGFNYHHHLGKKA
jgi:hypothetical protein